MSNRKKLTQLRAELDPIREWRLFVDNQMVYTTESSLKAIRSLYPHRNGQNNYLRSPDNIRMNYQQALAFTGHDMRDWLMSLGKANARADGRPRDPGRGPIYENDADLD